MPAYPSCAKCLVCKGVRRIIDSYRFFQGAVKDSTVQRLTDHARGFRHGQLAVLDEVVSDLNDIAPGLEIERKLRIIGKGE